MASVDPARLPRAERRHWSLRAALGVHRASPAILAFTPRNTGEWTIRGCDARPVTVIQGSATWPTLPRRGVGVILSSVVVIPRRLWPFLIAAVLPSCSSAAASPPQNPLSGAAQSLSVPGAVEPYVFGGERLVGKVVVLGIDAGEATVSVEGGCGTERAPITVRTRGWATGLFALLANSWLELDSTLLPGLAMPVSGRNEIKIGSRHRKYTVSYDQGQYRYEYRLNGEVVAAERVPLPAELRPHDLHSAILYLRSWRPAPETRSELLVVMGRHLWHLEVVFKGPDIVTSADGPRPAVRIEGLATKQSKDPGKRTQRKFFAWFSDDDERVPLRGLAESEFGPVELVATSYSCPECGSVCRVESSRR